MQLFNIRGIGHVDDQLETYSMSLTNGKNLNSCNKNGQTPLFTAAMKGHEVVVQWLLERKDVEPDSKDKSTRTPLSWAAENGHEAVVRLLLERKDVEPDSKDKSTRTPLSWAAEKIGRAHV